MVTAPRGYNDVRDKIAKYPGESTTASCPSPHARPSLTSAQPVQRVVSLAALAAAGCGGLYFAAESGALASWGLPFFKPWQVLYRKCFSEH